MFRRGSTSGMPGLDIGQKTPVEMHETRRAGRALDYQVPQMQARAVAFAIVGIFSTLLTATVTVGPVVFWVVSGAFVVTSLIWAIMFAQRWEDGITPADLLTSAMLAVLTGYIAWCISQVIAWLGFSVPDWLQRPLAVFTLLSLVFFISYTALLALAFVQELLYRSPFFEQFLFQEGFSWLFGWLLRRQKPPARDMPMMINYQLPTAQELAQHEPPPETELTRLELFLLHTYDCNTLSREALCATGMRDGSRLKQTEWTNCVAHLRRQGYITQNGGTRWAPGAAPDVALAAITRPTPP